MLRTVVVFIAGVLIGGLVVWKLPRSDRAGQRTRQRKHQRLISLH